MSVNTHSQQHEMQLEIIHPAGPQEWVCSACTRRLLLQLEPKFNITVLDFGDERFSHVGSTTDSLHIGSPQINEVEEAILSDELRAALEEALKDIDFDDW